MAVKTKEAKKGKKTPKTRSSWRGMLRFGLVVFPVEAFNAHARGHGPIAFHQLHSVCHSRIQYKKVCPIHGEVSNDEIISAYEYSKGKYVDFEPEELDKLRTEKERSLTIDAFIEPRELDPIYFDGRMYFLAPAAAEASEPYAVLARAMEHLGRDGVGEIVFSGKKEAVLVRTYAGSLQMAMLNYASEIEQPAAAKTPRVAPSEKSLALAEELIESWTEKKFDFSRYVDRFEEEVRRLIDAKIHGRDVVAAEEEEEQPSVLNLMDALKKSMAHSRTTRGSAGKASNASRQKHPNRKRRPRSRRRAS